MATCEYCDGTGDIEYAKLVTEQHEEPKYIHSKEKCVWCDGSGVLPDNMEDYAREEEYDDYGY